MVTAPSCRTERGMSAADYMKRPRIFQVIACAAVRITPELVAEHREELGETALLFL